MQGKVVPQEPDELSIYFSLLECVLRTDRINNSSVTSGDSFPKCPVGIHREAFSPRQTPVGTGVPDGPHTQCSRRTGVGTAIGRPPADQWHSITVRLFFCYFGMGQSNQSPTGDRCGKCAKSPAPRAALMDMQRRGMRVPFHAEKAYAFLGQRRLPQGWPDYADASGRGL